MLQGDGAVRARWDDGPHGQIAEVGGVKQRSWAAVPASDHLNGA